MGLRSGVASGDSGISGTTPAPRRWLGTPEGMAALFATIQAAPALALWPLLGECLAIAAQLHARGYAQDRAWEVARRVLLHRQRHAEAGVP
jgi:hypothetical protein